jgi:hypothetical protein
LFSLAWISSGVAGMTEKLWVCETCGVRSLLDDDDDGMPCDQGKEAARKPDENVQCRPL